MAEAGRAEIDGLLSWQVEVLADGPAGQIRGLRAVSCFTDRKVKAHHEILQQSARVLQAQVGARSQMRGLLEKYRVRPVHLADIDWKALQSTLSHFEQVDERDARFSAPKRCSS
jgi:hypothetical protein